MSGPEPLFPSDVWAWNQLTGSGMSAREYEIIRAMDAAYMDGVRKHQEEQRTRYVDQTGRGNNRGKRG